VDPVVGGGLGFKLVGLVLPLLALLLVPPPPNLNILPSEDRIE
jgi:hypothetical protein